MLEPILAQASLADWINAVIPAAAVVLPLAGFAAIAGGCLAASRLLSSRNSRLDRRLTALPDEASDDAVNEGIFGPLTPALAAQLPESKRERVHFRQLLRGAGLYRPGTATTIYALRFVLLFVPLVIAGLLCIVEPERAFRIMIVGGLLSGCLSIIPRLWVYFRRRRRLAQIRLGLPDTMDMLAMCMDGGVSLSQSLTQVARKLENYPALAEELLILKRQAEVGSLKQALADLASRVELPELRGLCALLSRGDRLGTRLSGSLLEQSDHLRTQRRQKAMLAANKTPVKLVLPLMFCFAPAALIVLTGPAVLELKELLAPSNGRNVFSSNETLDTNSRDGIAESLQRLDQNFEQ